MSDKVTLPKEIADAIERTKSKHYTWSDHDLCYIVLNQLGYCQYEDDADIKLIHKWSNTRELTFVKALINGYEVEQTPEDKVRELYQFWDNHEGDSIYSGQTIASHISDVLNILNIKIEGINT